MQLGLRYQLHDLRRLDTRRSEIRKHGGPDASPATRLRMPTPASQAEILELNSQNSQKTLLQPKRRSGMPSGS